MKIEYITKLPYWIIFELKCVEIYAYIFNDFFALQQTIEKLQHKIQALNVQLGDVWNGKHYNKVGLRNIPITVHAFLITFQSGSLCPVA